MNDLSNGWKHYFCFSDTCFCVLIDLNRFLCFKLVFISLFQLSFVEICKLSNLGMAENEIVKDYFYCFLSLPLFCILVETWNAKSCLASRILELSNFFFLYNLLSSD